MSIKKRLSMGAMSATLGLSLVAGGTWAAFNDVENVIASVGAGTLKMDLKEYQNKPWNFDISNLKPGDSMTRNVIFDNKGTLAIKDVLMGIELVEFDDYAPESGEAGENDLDTWGTNGALEYLDQFKVSIMKVGAEGSSDGVFPYDLIPSTSNVTLKDFYLASDSILGDQNKVDNGATAADIATARQKVWTSVNQNYITDYRLNVSTINPDQWSGLPVVPHDDDMLQIKIEFVDTKVDTNGDGTWDQNKFQGDKADIKVSFEARQWGGLDVQDRDVNPAGSVETNKKAYSEANNPKRP
jgi:spore coat-associated protein N